MSENPATRCLIDAEKKAQGARCGCKGYDDYCVCQNVPDRVTAKEWGLRSPLPSVYYNLTDLLQNIAAPDSDPGMDIADGLTMMDYWRNDAKRLLPSVTSGEIAVDEIRGRILDDAGRQADTLRCLRQEYRSPSANFPTMMPVQYAQDAAKTIETLIAIIRDAALSKSQAIPNG